MTMVQRKERLAKLVKVLEQLTAFHETKRAGFLAEAAAADRDALEIAGRFDQEGSLSNLFPELYNRRISRALAQKEEYAAKADAEANLVAKAMARANAAEREYRAARNQDERERADRERLELIERQKPEPERK